MRSTALKTFIWISILLFAGLIILIVRSFVSRTMLQESNVPPPLESGEAQTEAQGIGCDSVVFVMDADGNAYWNQSNLADGKKKTARGYPVNRNEIKFQAPPDSFFSTLPGPFTVLFTTASPS